MSIDWDGLVLGPIRQAMGEPFTLAPKAGGGASPFDGVWQEAYTGITFGEDGSQQHTTLAPNVGVQLSQLGTSPARDDVITRLATGRQYRVVDVHVDGLGWASLILKDRP